MLELNKDIISEITCLKNTSEEMKKFLEWLVKFEHSKIDRENYSYKTEIINELNKIFNL